MKANELRIGNILLNGKVTELGEDHIMVFDGYQHWHSTNIKFEPMPLTEEWLYKFGASRYSSVNYKIMIGALTMLIRFNGGKCYSELGDIYLGANIQYVHQLQNLYFALTGKELVPTTEKEL